MATSLPARAWGWAGCAQPLTFPFYVLSGKCPAARNNTTQPSVKTCGRLSSFKMYNTDFLLPCAAVLIVTSKTGSRALVGLECGFPKKKKKILSCELNICIANYVQSVEHAFHLFWWFPSLPVLNLKRIKERSLFFPSPLVYAFSWWKIYRL